MFSFMVSPRLSGQH